MTAILIIDDERPTLDMLSLFLEAYGYAPMTAETGEEGIRLYQEHSPDIVITDIKMPGMDGIQVLKRIKGLSPHTEVIVVTGHGDMDLAIQALNLSATDFINKPVKKEALEGALKRAEERLNSKRRLENDISVRMSDGVALMDVHGNVTSRSESYLQEAFNQIIREGRDRIVMCFDENATVNGAGIAVLTQLFLEGSRKGHKVAICGLSDNFKKVFDVVGITKYATLHDTEDEALAKLASA